MWTQSLSDFNWPWCMVSHSRGAVYCHSAAIFVFPFPGNASCALLSPAQFYLHDDSSKGFQVDWPALLPHPSLLSFADAAMEAAGSNSFHMSQPGNGWLPWKPSESATSQVAAANERKCYGGAGSIFPLKSPAILQRMDPLQNSSTCLGCSAWLGRGRGRCFRMKQDFPSWGVFSLGAACNGWLGPKWCLLVETLQALTSHRRRKQVLLPLARLVPQSRF